MSKSRHATTGRTITAILAAAIVACLMVAAPSLVGVPEVRAEPQSKLVVDPARFTNEVSPIPLKGGACSLLEWPNYEQSCQFDARQRAAEMPTVRIIAVR
jgi:hypothetical protein